MANKATLDENQQKSDRLTLPNSKAEKKRVGYFDICSYCKADGIHASISSVCVCNTREINDTERKRHRKCFVRLSFSFWPKLS